jgi:hypothetical protein
MSERESNGIMVPAGSRSARCAVLRWILALTTLSVLVFVPAGPSWAQSQSTESKSTTAGATTSAKIAVVDTATVTQAATAKPAADSAAPAAQSASKGQQEGIKIHGHWTIEVKNPDGKLVTHREFENTLTPAGAQTLADILSGQNFVGSWAVAVVSSGTPPCSLVTLPPPLTSFLTLPASGGCLIASTGAVGTALCTNQVTKAAVPGCFATMAPPLEIAEPNGNEGAELIGTATAVQTGNITEVGTFIFHAVCVDNAGVKLVGGCYGPLNGLNGSQPSSSLTVFEPSISSFSDTGSTGPLVTNPIPVTSQQTISVLVNFSLQ